MLLVSHFGSTRFFNRGIQLAKPTSYRPRRPIPPQWICSACCSSVLGRASISTTPPTTDRKPYYVTTPIFYVNAAPHIGHMYSMLLADILKRWQQLQKRHAILSTGVDEHGMKVQRSAIKAGEDPQTFCDQGAEMLKSLAKHANISYDHFVRTTGKDHKEAVQFAWTVLQDRGYIYESKHEGWYSVSDETFYPSSAVHMIVEPATGRKIMTSMESGKEVEWTSEVNYRFRLSAFRDRLLDLYKKNPGFVAPRFRGEDLVVELTKGLEDLSVSRPTTRLDWGVRVPTDESQTIYVWLDALLNYVTIAGFPWTPGREQIGGWPADCQVIGKDIMRFHCIYWPAFLMALGVPLPNNILVHCHWTLGKEKMAKSTGNVVNPFYAIDRFGVDVIRYYLALDGRLAKDSDYANEFIIERYQKHLQGRLGNLTSRLLRGKKWNVRKTIEQIVGTGAGRVEAIAHARSPVVSAQFKMLQDLAKNYKEKMDSLNTTTGLEYVMQLLHTTNAFMSTMEPWQLAVSESEEDRQELDHVVFLCAEALRISGILLQPFMPEKSAFLLDMLGVDETKRFFDSADVGADRDYGVSRVELGSGHEGTLFPPLTSLE